MSKKLNPCPAEWKKNIETVFEKASLRAFGENKGRKKKPDYDQFKKKVISYTPQFVSGQEAFISGKFGDAKRQEFLECFKLAKGHVEKGEDSDLEKIIQKWHDKLEKES